MGAAVLPSRHTVFGAAASAAAKTAKHPLYPWTETVSKATGIGPYGTVEYAQNAATEAMDAEKAGPPPESPDFGNDRVREAMLRMKRRTGKTGLAGTFLTPRGDTSAPTTQKPTLLGGA